MQPCRQTWAHRLRLRRGKRSRLCHKGLCHQRMPWLQVLQREQALRLAQQQQGLLPGPPQLGLVQGRLNWWQQHLQLGAQGWGIAHLLHSP